METLALDQRVRPWSRGRSAILFRCQEVLSAVSSELGGFSVDLGSGERISSKSPLAPKENKDLAEEPRPAFSVFSPVYLTPSEMMNVRRQTVTMPLNSVAGA
ncbi:anaphase-promoting complex subunit CDC26 isoform X1 [Physeter macrocephalus]|uniref:Anaphase-promoting complex subunit CDC26 isoform X1 n=1 Tax=Physeter macrocephalus TaxID=9755 RepID=A0A2Y9T172_PHYMC|nr:anaphase-promoting complex subunit CDC26 isoform X1 [Physeter catodon]|eukprot:XP_023981884.1 anaphase-promoting complex subunit CDC26 isoform X1 [Physeter catodon]